MAKPALSAAIPQTRLSANRSVQALNLANLKPTMRAQLVGFVTSAKHSAEALELHLLTMGLARGVKIEVLRQAHSNDGLMMIRVDHQCMALRRSDAVNMLVQPL